MSCLSKAQIALLACLIPVMTGCAATPAGRMDLAEGAASSAHLQHVKFKAQPFVLTGWQRLSKQGEPVHIYIEGDGAAWTGRARLSPNPTPKDPIALLLAGRDPGANVLYLARPCQYTAPDTAGNEACSNPAYWSSKRFGREVLESYMSVLDQVSLQNGTKEFHITGYSGGANIAGLLAARRTDITKIRTVAGNIDNDYFTRFHGVSNMPDSLNMANDVPSLSHIPQIHFIGGNDKIVPVDIYKSYALKAGNMSCIHYRVLPQLAHHEGWQESWPGLLSAPVTCE